MSNIYTDYCNSNTISVETSSGGTVHAVKMILFTNNISLDHGTLLADLQQPLSVSGYSATAITWSSSFQQPDGSFAVNSNLIQFLGDSANPVTISGAAVIGGPVLHRSLVGRYFCDTCTSTD